MLPHHRRQRIAHCATGSDTSRSNSKATWLVEALLFVEGHAAETMADFQGFLLGLEDAQSNRSKQRRSARAGATM
jgi:hypothetical protein